MKKVVRKLKCYLAMALVVVMMMPVSVHAEEVPDVIPQESETKIEQPEESQSEEEQLEESQSEEGQPEESQPEEGQPEESQPEESQPEETKPEETKPNETKPEETKPPKKPKKKVGPKKENGKWYIYNKKGKKAAGTLKDGTYTYKLDGVTYYLTKKKVVEARKKGSTYYYANGKKMDKVDAYNFETELTARKIAAKITKKDKNLSAKMRTCFKWVMDKYYVMPRTFKNTRGWPAVYANDHFKKGKGDCHSDASAFAYLAKAIGCKNIYVCNDSKGPGHAWCEIEGKVYDPLFAQVKAKGGMAKNYGVKYKKKGGCYPLLPVLHIKIG